MLDLSTRSISAARYRFHCFPRLVVTARSADRLELSLVSELVEMNKEQAEKLVRSLVLWLESDVVVTTTLAA